MDGETLLTLALAQPIEISPSATDTTTLMRFFVKDSFRWLDQAEPDYTDGMWDVPIALLPEPVFQVGANGFEVQTL